MEIALVHVTLAITVALVKVQIVAVVVAVVVVTVAAIVTVVVVVTGAVVVFVALSATVQNQICCYPFQGAAKNVAPAHSYITIG